MDYFSLDDINYHTVHKNAIWLMLWGKNEI